MPNLSAKYPENCISLDEKYEYLYERVKLYRNDAISLQEAQEVFVKAVKLLVQKKYPKAINIITQAYQFGVGVQKDEDKAFILCCYNYINSPSPSNLKMLLNSFVKIQYDMHNVKVEDIVTLAKCCGISSTSINKLNDSRNPSVPSLDIDVQQADTDQLVKILDKIKAESKKVILPEENEDINNEDLNKFIIGLLTNSFYERAEKELKDKVVLNPNANKRCKMHKPRGATTTVNNTKYIRKKVKDKTKEDSSFDDMPIYQKLSKRVIGQKEAVEAVVLNKLNYENGLAENEGPRAKYFFYGYTGTGKTELAKAIAEIEYSNQPVILGMESYTGEDGVARLIGSSPGYRDSGTGGKLINVLDAKPRSVIVFDEIEKADDAVIQSLLGLLDRGEIQDGFGKVHNAREATFIFTSNVGAKEATLAKVEEGSEEEREIFLQEIKKTFSPEFLGRLPNQILFRRLPKEVLRTILLQEIAKKNRKLTEKKQSFISLTEDAIEHILKEPEVLDKNVRGLKAVIDGKVLRKISRPLQSAQATEFEIFYNDGEYDYIPYGLEVKGPNQSAEHNCQER